MKSISNFFCDESSQFFCDESGLELAEYAVAAALVALAVVLAFTNLGNSITNSLNSLASFISS